MLKRPLSHRSFYFHKFKSAKALSDYSKKVFLVPYDDINLEHSRKTDPI